jgi:disulfide oxidoreductase YuzD
MDIIKVLSSEINGTMDRWAFEINTCLSIPTEKDTLERLAVAVERYTFAKQQFEMLQELMGRLNQVQAQSQDEQPIEN